MPAITSQRGTGLTWSDVARYYGISVEQLFRGSSLYAAGERQPRPGQRVGGGVTLNVPSVVNSVQLPGGGFANRRDQNVFENTNYIERRQAASANQAERDDLSHEVTEDQYWGSTQIDWTYLQQLVSSGGAPPPWWQNVLDSGRNLPDWIPTTGAWAGSGSGGGGNGPTVPVPTETGGGETQGDEDEEGNPATDPNVPETPGGLTENQALNAIQMAIGAFPWIETLGLTDMVVGWIRNDGYTGDALVGLIRQQPAWESMFVGLRRPDQTLRMSEGQYLATMDQYRGVLQAQLGSQALELTNAQLSNFMVNEIDANEVRDRLQIYDQLVQHGGAVRAAFYVYGGMRLSDDDLYNYVVDPFTQQSFNDQYLTAQSPDYSTFLARTAEVVIDEFGAPITVEQAVPLLDVLYHGGNPTGGDYLSLAELSNAFELAMLGSTATSQGLVMPDLDTVMEMRSAGVNRTQALQAYGQFVRDRNILNSMSARAGDGAFTQSEFEDATFMADGDILRDVNRAQAQEDAQSRPSGTPEFSRTGPGRVGQSGLSSFRS